MANKSEIVTALTAHLKQSDPHLTQGQVATLTDAFAADFEKKFPGSDMPGPGEDALKGLLSPWRGDHPEMFRTVPSVDAVISHLGKNAVNPTQKLQIAHEVAAMTEGERLAAVPYVKGEQFTPAQEPPKPPHRREVEPSLRERCEAQALDFHGQSASARLSQARAIARGETASKPDTAGAAKAAGRELRPVEKLKAAREAARR